MHRMKLSARDVAKICELYQAGYQATNIGKRFGKSGSTIHEIARRHLGDDVERGVPEYVMQKVEMRGTVYHSARFGNLK